MMAFRHDDPEAGLDAIGRAIEDVTHDAVAMIGSPDEASSAMAAARLPE